MNVTKANAKTLRTPTSIVSPSAEISVDKTASLESTPPKSEANATTNAFEGTRDTPVETPLPSTPGGSRPHQVRMTAKASPKRPTVHQSLRALLPPELAHKAIASGATTVLDGLKAIDDDTLMSLLSSRFSAHQAQSEAKGHSPLSLGVQYVDVGRLVPGQTRISIDRVREKVATQVELGGHVVLGDAVEFGYGDGHASVPLNRPKPAIAGPNGQVLVIDGNHQAVATMLTGARQTPIDIVADHQAMTPEAFAKLADDNGWVYLNAIGGAEATEPATYASLTNDPVRFLMSEAAFKASHDGTGAVVFEETDRPQSRAWVKLAGQTVDFVEFKLADLLYQAADRDPALKAALFAPDDEDLAIRGPAVRGALNAAIAAGSLDPEALGIAVLNAPVSSPIDLEALALVVDARLTA